MHPIMKARLGVCKQTRGCSSAALKASGHVIGTMEALVAGVFAFCIFPAAGRVLRVTLGEICLDLWQRARWTRKGHTRERAWAQGLPQPSVSLFFF